MVHVKIRIQNHFHRFGLKSFKALGGAYAVQKISKNKKCNLFIELNKLLPLHAQNLDHPFGKYYLSESSVKKILPLLSKQNYLKRVDIFKNQKIVFSVANCKLVALA